MFLDLEPLVAGHLALAIDNHRAWCRANHRPFPPELSELALHLTGAATRRQDAPTPTTELADPAGTPEGRHVARILLTVLEVAEVLNVSERTVRRRITDGDLQAVRLGNATRVHRDDLTAYLDRLRDGDTP